MRSKLQTPAALLLAALVAAPALSGCLGSAQATAGDHASTAEDRASEWSSNPRMIQVVGLEGSFAFGFGDWAGSADEDAPYWDRARDDPDVGDGRTEIWVYRFVSEDDPDTVLEVVVDKEGEIVHTDEEPRGGDEPVGEWSVDSDEAAETAREGNQGLREGTSSDHYGMVLLLQEDDDPENPTWTVVGGGGDASGGGGGIVVIDAVTGEVLSSRGGFGSP